MFNRVESRQTQPQQGFTIVELLIVVVVIAILAAITIVAYNGIQQSSKASSLQSTVSQLARKLESIKVSSSTELYPASLSAAGVNAPANVTYSVSSTAKAFCIIAVDGTQSYFATSFQTQPARGSCGTADGLVSWWRLNGDPADANGGLNSATANGQTATAGQNGQAGGAYSFNAAVAAMSTTGTGLPTGSAARTVTAWVNPSAYPAASAWFMVHSYGGSGTANASALSINASGRLTFNGQSNDFMSSFVVPQNTWSFVAYTVSGNQATIAFNDTVNSGTLTSTLATSTGTNGLIGAYVGGANRWVGSIDDLRVYNRVLSTTELQAAYAAGAL